MTWIPIVWSMNAGVFLTIGIIYLMIGLKQTGERTHLAFSVIAISMVAIACFELLLMRARTPGEFGVILRWAHVPVFTFVVAIVVFLRSYLLAGRLWLAYAACGLRLLSLILDLNLDPNINYLAITSLQQVRLFGGETAAVAVGIRNPWLTIAELSSLFLLLFMADALIAHWRRGGRMRHRRALLIGGSLMFMVAVTVVDSALVHAGIIKSIYLFSLPFLVVVAAVSFELSAGVIHAAQIAGQERAFLRQVIDIAPNLIFAKDRDGRFTLANHAVADLYGTTADALIGRTDADFNRSPEEVEAFRQTDLEVIDTLRERLIPEEKITDALGRTHWLQTVKRPILGEDGAASQVLGSATDITARKHSELELAGLRNELAHLSRVTMLSELSGSLAHELNQPLTAILSNAQAALRFLAEPQPDVEEVREILQDIVSDDKRAGEVIQGLRLLLKKGEMRLGPLDLNDVVRDVLRLVHSDMLNSGVGLTTQFAPDLPNVDGDRVQLQQVVLNLVVNGCDAMTGIEAGDRRLVVSTEFAGGEGVRLCVADRGRGIPPEGLERVFDAFFTTKEQGLGLGLAVCRKIIAAHGGRLWATNNAGGGASFCLTLSVSPGGAA